MRDPLAKGGSTHILFIDMMRGEIPGNTCEEIDIAFAYSLGKFYCFADTYVKFGYDGFCGRSDMILSSVGSFAQAISGGLPSRRLDHAAEFRVRCRELFSVNGRGGTG